MRRESIALAGPLPAQMTCVWQILTPPKSNLNQPLLSSRSTGDSYNMDMPKTILVVDDKANVRQLLRDYLTEQGFNVVAAANGREALYAARHDTPDVILLDIMMPEMDGYEFLQHYRREQSTPVIVITARGRCFGAGIGRG
jgi:PleD family two-component response regulator